MKSSALIWPGVLAVVAAAYVGYNHWRTADLPSAPASHQPGDTLHYPANAPQLAYLQIQPVKAEPVPLVEPLNAHLAYDDNHTARVSSPIAGRVLRILAETGQTVHAGEALAMIDAPDYAQAVSDELKAQAELQRKQENFDRAKVLFDGQVLARRDMESAQADLQQARAESDRARERLHNLGGGHGKDADGHFVLRAPLSGVVSERQISAGSEVRPDAAAPLFVITNPEHLWVLVDLPERDLASVKVGQFAYTQVDAFPGESFLAKISVIGETLDPTTRRIQVRCEIDNPQNRLKPEMYARVSPIADDGSRLPQIPNGALVTEGLHSYVFVETAPGTLQKRQVTLKLQGHDHSYIQQGLHEGERVVTSGALLLDSELSGAD